MVPIIMKVYAVTSLALTLFASTATAKSSESQNIQPRPSCQDLKHKALHLNQCMSAYNFYQQIVNNIALNNLLKQPASPSSQLNYRSSEKFTYYEHLPNKNSKPAYSDQTPYSCENAFKTPGSSNQSPYSKAGFFKNYGGGAPLCNALNYIQTVGNPNWDPSQPIQKCTHPNQANNNYKCSGNYFSALTNTHAIKLIHTAPLTWKPLINSLGTNTISTYLESGGPLGTPSTSKISEYYSPNTPYRIYTTNKSNQPIIPKTGFYGMSGGGGSGSGFEVKIAYNHACYLENKASLQKLGLNNKNCTAQPRKGNCSITAFSGGFGGGGGMTTSRTSSPSTIYIDGGGGGGAQFNLGISNSIMQSASIGAGSNYNPSTLTIPTQLSINNMDAYLTTLDNFSNNKSRYLLKKFTQSGPCINHIEIQGGGGMGAGFEVIGPNSEEYTPHPYSSSGGFQFAVKLHPVFMTADNSKRLQRTTPAEINRGVSNFYQFSGVYWKHATSRKITNLLIEKSGGGWGSCPLTLSNLRNLSIYCMAAYPAQWKINKPSTLDFNSMQPYMFMNYLTSTDNNPKCNPLNIKNFTQKHYPHAASFEKACRLIAPFSNGL